MRDEILTSYDLNLDHLRRLVADLDDAAMVTSSGVAPNHPAWTIGHLVVSAQGMCGELGVAPWLPPDWPARFGSGSTPTTEAPPKAELLAALDDARSRIGTALVDLGDASLAGPLPDETYRRTLPTLAHALVHILCSHAAMHVGELIVWRRVMDLPRVPERFDRRQ